jgi:hypothetical protein
VVSPPITDNRDGDGDEEEDWGREVSMAEPEIESQSP